MVQAEGGSSHAVAVSGHYRIYKVEASGSRVQISSGAASSNGKFFTHLGLGSFLFQGESDGGGTCSAERLVISDLNAKYSVRMVCR